MGVFSRLNEQQKKQTEAENAMPGAYENRYDESIQNALENMNRQNTAGTGFDGSNVDYRGALSRLFGNAGAGADAAAQTANQLSGGYGASWAQSAADQSAASRAQAGAPGALAKARVDALTQWQQELAGQSSQLDSLLGQDQLERGEYDGSVANAQDWRNYQYGRTEQARTEKNDLLSNVWNAVQMVGSAVLQGYDAYKGYRQQDWENAFAERQYSDTLSRTELSDQMAALQQAAAYKQAGFDDANKAEAARMEAATAASEAGAAQSAAKGSASRAEMAAARAELTAPSDGAVRSVNGKGGVVTLTAEDLGAVGANSAGYVKSISLTDRTLTLTFGDGSTKTMQTKDTTTLENMTGILPAAHGGTGKNTPLTAEDVGAVEKGSGDYLRSAEPQNGELVLTFGSGDTVRYTLPATTTTALGGVKLSEDFTADADGTLHLAGGTAPNPYPVGSIYQSTDPPSPAALFGGSWEEIASERVLMGA